MDTPTWEQSEPLPGATPTWEESTPAPGMGESFARGALRNFPLAQQAAAAVAPINPFSEKRNYSEEMRHLTDAAEASKAAHKGAYGAGAVTGTAGPLLIPAVGEALGAGAALMPALEIASGAGMAGGAANAAAQSISDVDLTRPTGRDALNAGMSAALGATLGKMFGPKAAPAAAGVEDVASKAAGDLAPAGESSIPGAIQTAASSAIPAPKVSGSAHIPGGIVPDQTHVAEDFVPTASRIAASNWARGIGFTPRKFSAYARELGENPQIAALEGQAWSEEKGLIKFMDHPGEALERIGPIKQSAGKIIGDTMERIGSQPIPAEEIKTELLDLAKRTANPSAKGTIVNVADRIDEMSADGVLDWHALNELKGMVGQEVSEHPNLSKAYGLLAQRMNTMAEATGKQIGDPAMSAAYQAAKRDYRMASLLEPALLYSESKNLIGGPAGHNTLRGVLGQLVEALTGLPPAEQLIKNAMAKSSPAIKSVGKLGENIGAGLKSYVPAQARKAAPSGNLSKAAQLELINALQSRFGAKKK